MRQGNIMVSDALVLQIPPSLSERAQRAAQALQQPVDELLLQTLDATLPRLDDVPPEMAADMAELPAMDDAALWCIARSTISPERQEQLQDLMDAQQNRPLTPDEQTQLDAIRREIGQRTLLKAQAYALLSQRGYPVPQP
jgi:hypothetical protein